ncbi:DNA-binding MarR family transcriptional regulator [Stackebrandtia endophytica]|uniref:DNA-binding MarR family transcriptional regulator n=1 Tax=Stackebrandtia endophytica TaxID=1496996 RepID=A0A543B140_9ACTN|nr:MarR family transcriptional regulator [Stackebrandtia endophytica]TQL78500.1 DNA-binding MarR family transcriptional regulator [Stackebrandtia endophytica]
MSGPRWLSPTEDRAWRAFNRMQTVLPAQLARDLQQDSGLSDADYEVLSTLSEKPDHRWQLRELAAKMLWSRSRLSHHVARMEQRDLVARDSDPDDGRGTTITLTDIGVRTLGAAAPHHVESVRRHLIDLLTPEEVTALATIAERVVDRLEAGRR